MDGAVVMLGISKQEIEKQGDPSTIDVVGGGKIKSYGFRRNLRLWHQGQGGDFIEIHDAWICVLPSLIKGVPAVIGQIDGFQEKVLRHENRRRNRVWQLWVP